MPRGKHWTKTEGVLTREEIDALCAAVDHPLLKRVEEGIARFVNY